MPVYVYKAVTDKGLIIRNKVEEGSKQELIKKLKNKLKKQLFLKKREEMKIYMLVKELNDESPGYHPFLIKEYWQVAKLNYCTSQDAKNIKDLEIHEHTDETFTLLKVMRMLS